MEVVWLSLVKLLSLIDFLLCWFSFATRFALNDFACVNAPLVWHSFLSTDSQNQDSASSNEGVLMVNIFVVVAQKSPITWMCTVVSTRSKFKISPKWFSKLSTGPVPNCGNWTPLTTGTIVRCLGMLISRIFASKQRLLASANSTIATN